MSFDVHMKKEKKKIHYPIIVQIVILLDLLILTENSDGLFCLDHI